MYDLLRSSSFRLLPGRCLLCGDLTGRDIDLCIGCEQDLPYNNTCCKRCALPVASNSATGLCMTCTRKPPPFERTISSFIYSFPIGEMITTFKEHRQFVYGHLLASLLARHTGFDCLPQDSLLLPVPLSRRRLRRRGFNQAEEIANVIARRRALPVLASVLDSTGAGTPQKLLNAAARRRQVKGSYRIRAGTAAEIRGRNLVLVDDVMTTAATATEITRCLLDAGAAHVSIAVLARTPAGIL